jgi:glycosyltransferase involved in cell wall biosynthesis
MRVLRIIPSVDPSSGGPIEGLVQQAKVHALSGIVTEVASLDPPEASFVRHCSLRVHPLGAGRTMPVGWKRLLPWVHYGYAPAAVSWLRAHACEYDLVVVEGVWTYAAMIARRVLVGGKLPYVVFTHGMLDPWFRKTYPLKHVAKQLLWWFCEGPLLNNAKAVLFTTEDEMVVSRHEFFPYRVRERVVGFGTADVLGDDKAQNAAFRAALPALGGKRYLLFLSRIHRKKGIDLLIDAFARIAAVHPDLDLVVAGPDHAGLSSELAGRAETLGVAGRIHWPGMLNGDVKWGAFRGAEAFVLPSHQENFGVVVVEAMAAQTPVLITDKVNIWREVKACGGGLVEPDDVDGIVRLLQGFLGLSGEMRSEMRRCARAGFVEYFEINRAAATIAQTMREATHA